MLDVFSTKQFEKDVSKIKKQGKDIKLLENVMNDIKEETTLKPKYKEHMLKGEYENCSECHIQPNWLLIYYFGENSVIFYRTGSHSELFD
jgi:mRNA interferase YafQ